ncbi:WXG100 family type VII secretion target [Saccharomonospora glauca]|jgi:hypothetical protein|uniref:ESX-1 secretion-associated protein EspA/EspE-like domain-containing protein n=1 Tax=Saccharomonospora glauca K62 TaxID=928724 RepID=I1D1Q1_9PSEU|nr:hypothetical protein [Saccharomonospora glauca]EIE98875.1 hypothetical protein SacglDRAFT_01967 [Saccharomonospora glauca K62]
MTTTSRTQHEPSERSAVEISTALADLRIAGDAIGGKQWLSADLAGEPVVSINMLGSTASPLSALASAGCDFLTPLISFLEEPLAQLRGEPDSVSGPAAEHDEAARSANAVADDYRSTVESETSEWSGDAKTNYTQTAYQLVDGILSIAETAATNAKAMIAAGEVVAQVVDIVTRLITEAVGKIVPIMTEAIAAAPATFGASIAQAIPQCVAIAVDYGGRIAAKLGELLASGENLVKLIEGATGVLKVVRQGLTVIGDLAGGGAPSDTGAQSVKELPKPETNTESRGEEDQPQPEVDNPLDGEWSPITRE